LLPLAGALAAGAVAYLMAARAPESGAAALPPFRSQAMAAEERRWVDDTLPPRYLPSPVAPAPCGYVGRDWAGPLSDAHRYISAGQTHSAEVVLYRYLSTPSAIDLQNDAGAAVRSPGLDPASPPTIDVLGAVHLLHASAYVLLKRHATGPSLWRALKNPIGYTDLLSRRGVVGPLRGEYTWSRIAIPSPGCGSMPDSLTSYHLYNNLILGYLANPTYHEADSARQTAEFKREYDDPVESNPLWSVMKQQLAEPPVGREGWRWAVSNGERLLRELTWQRNRDSLQVPAWLAVNLAQLLDSARTETRPDVAEALVYQRDVMLAEAERSAADARGEQHQDLALALARLQLLRGIDGRGGFAVSPWILSRLDTEQAAVVQAVSRAASWRHDPEVLEAALSSGVIADSLGVHEPHAWMAAARRDLSRYYARRAAGAAPKDRGAWERRARKVLAGDTAPPELRDLEASWNVLELLQRNPPFAFVLGMAVALPLMAYLAWLLNRRKAVWVSYYRQEAREQARRR
jgi:hypothetical protein